MTTLNSSMDKTEFLDELAKLISFVHYNVGAARVETTRFSQSGLDVQSSEDIFERMNKIKDHTFRLMQWASNVATILYIPNEKERYSLFITAYRVETLLNVLTEVCDKHVAENDNVEFSSRFSECIGLAQQNIKTVVSISQSEFPE